MNRFRHLAHEYLLPLVISALVLRALIPVGFMPGGSSLLTAALCNPVAGESRTETLSIPDAGLPGGMAKMHCDFCLAPMWGAAFSLPTLAQADAIPFETPPERADAPQPRFARDRAQIPRAPPLA